MESDERFVTVNGFVWPKDDRHCRAVVFDTVHDMDPAIALCTGRRFAVQAGGNCGVWPLYLADKFEHVLTCEPDPLNFECLRRNVANTKIAHKNVGLGEFAMRSAMARDPKNIGAHHLDLTGDGDTVPIVPLDLIAPYTVPLDFLCLDIEGYELSALRGARRMIERHRPVIQIEDKGLSDKFGVKKGDAEKWLAANFGYKVRHRIKRDVILSCDVP